MNATEIRPAPSTSIPNDPGRARAVLWALGGAALVGGVAAWAIGGLYPGIVALWCFVAAAAAFALVLPMPYALVSPLFLGVAGWLIDMLPFVILAGWGVVVLRWGWSLLRARRLPRGGRWIWLPLGIAAWTALGILVITSADFKHWLLLLAIQVLASATLLLVVDVLSGFEARIALASGLVAFVVLLSSAVFLQWVGVNIQGLQDGTVRKRVEAAYGLDAFPNNIGMIKYARSIKAGALELKQRLQRVADATPNLPPFEVFQPKFQAYENSLVVRFQGSGRPFESVIRRAGIHLLYDNVGLAPANTVPRMRSFPRNALTYAGLCAAVLPFAFFLFWSGEKRRRLLGGAGVAASLFGAGFSLARGAWVAIAIGAVYFVLTRNVDRRHKIQLAGACVVAALVLTTVFLVRYGVDPLSGRAGGGASVNTRTDLYADTLAIVKGKHLFFGYGTERPRTVSGSVHEGTRYVPRAGTHSTYLNYLFRTGLPGALAILALYVIAWLHARTAAAVRAGPERLWSSLAATAVVIAAAHAVILSLYVEPIYTLGISAVLGLAMAGNDSLGAPLMPWKRRHASSRGEDSASPTGAR